MTVRLRHLRKRNQLITETTVITGKGQKQWPISFLKLYKWKFKFAFEIFILVYTMDKSLKIGLIGLAVLVIFILIIALINLNYSDSDIIDTSCLELNGAPTCHSTDENPYRYYGTKTAYHIVQPNDTEIIYGDCEPKLFYLFSRHATRYPDKEDIEDMAKELPNLRNKILLSYSEGTCKICEKDINRLKLWHMSMVPEDDNRISKSGEKEAYTLAQRFRKKFPILLDRSYSKEAFTFGYTSRLRTSETADAFAKGLFGESRKKYIDLRGNEKDYLLQFHIDCKKYMKDCNDNNLLNLKELKKFTKGPTLNQMTLSISKRLGFNITFNDAKMMYRACVFAYAHDDNDIWCSVFSKSELKVFEFDSDIDDYYKDAYGNAINYEQACPVVQHLVQSIKNSTADHHRRAVLLFSHAGAIKKLFARFGLFNDSQPLTSNSICQKYKWKSSFIAPFNCNLAFVLFQCGRDYKIIALHNEKPILIDGCDDLLCPIEKFYSKYNPIAENCDNLTTCCTCCSSSS